MITQPQSNPGHDAAAQQADDAQHYRAVLRKLVDIGVVLAERLTGAETPGAAGAGSAPEMAAAYARITRSVRRSIILAERVGKPVQARACPDDRAAARRRIIREVEDVIQREAWGTEAESLRDELQERLDGPDLEDDIGNRPVAEIIAEICRDLGIVAPLGTHPWQRRTPSDIAILSARAAEPRPAGAGAGSVAPGVVYDRQAPTGDGAMDEWSGRVASPYDG